LKENNQAVDRTVSREPEETPVVIMRQGNTTYQIGLHFSKTRKESLEEKLKKLMWRELLE